MLPLSFALYARTGIQSRQETLDRHCFCSLWDKANAKERMILSFQGMALSAPTITQRFRLVNKPVV